MVLREGEIAADGPPSEVFARTDLLMGCGVRPPGLGHALKLLGIDAQAESVEDAYDAIVRAYPRLAATLVDNSADSRAPEHPTNPENASTGSAFMAIENVSFSYGDGPRVLDSIDLRVEAGDFIAIVGQNGSGKTTLAKQIVGLLQPATGRVIIEGKDRAQMRPAETAREVAYVFQNPDHQIFAATVQEEVAFGPRNFGLADDEIRRRCDEALEAVGLLSERQSDPFMLSKGERQRLAVASVLVLRPRMLILDEPTTGLDAVSKQQVFAELLKAVENGERTVLISSHGLSDIERFADHVGMIKNGKLLLEGRTDEIVDRYRLAEFFTSNGAQFQNRDGLIILKRNENRWHALLDQKSGAHDWLQTRGAEQISLTRVTLEDLFVALAKDEEAK
jgi:energy-coupling factor transport system ATP-binding protein